jgi:hypothetical protein
MDDSKPPLEERALALSTCIAESHRAYQGLLELEKEQGCLIASEDLEGAAAKIAEKNHLLATIRACDERLHHQHIAWQSVRDEAPAALRERLQQQVNGLQALMTELLEAQTRNEENLKDHGEAINSKLMDLQKKKAATRGYQQQRAGDAYNKTKFYDSES